MEEKDVKAVGEKIVKTKGKGSRTGKDGNGSPIIGGNGIAPLSNDER